MKSNGCIIFSIENLDTNTNTNTNTNTSTSDYQLTKDGRYAHSISYIHSISSSIGYKTSSTNIQQRVLRYQGGVAVNGYIIVLKK